MTLPSNFSPRPARAGFARRWPDAAVLAVALFLVLPDRLFVAEQSLDHDFNLIDDSWKLELPARLARGEWAGRDFLFTYGPLYQVLHSVGPLIAPDNVAVQLRLARVLEGPLGVACLWIALWAVGAPPRWRRGLFLVWTLLFVATDRNMAGADLKPMAAIAAMALCGRLLMTGPKSALAVAWLLVPGLLALYSFDMGIVGFLALVGTLVVAMAASLVHHMPSQTRTLVAILSLWGAVLGFILVFRSLPGFEDYVPGSVLIAESYSQKMAIPFGPILPYPLLAALVINLSILGIVLTTLLRRPFEPAFDSCSFALLAAVIFSLAWLRYGVTRPDMHHVLRAVLPTVFVAGVLFPAWSARVRLALAFSLTFASLPLVVAAVCHLLVLDGWQGRLAAWRNVSLAAPTVLRANPGMTAVIDRVARQPEKYVYQWGNATILQLAAGKRNPAWTVQSVVATAEELEEGTIRSIEALSDLSVFFAPALHEVDGIPEEYRTPEIYGHLLRAFELAGPPEESLLFLRRAPEGARAWRSRPALESVWNDFDGNAIQLDLPPDFVRASDILQLSLAVAKPPVSGIFKPGRFQLAIHLENGEVQVWPLAVNADGRPHDYYVSFCSLRDRAFSSHWHPRRTWRSVEQVARIVLSWQPLDFLSCRPDWVKVEDLQLFERQGVEWIEMTRAHAREPAQLERLFGTGPYKDGGENPTDGL